MLSNDLDRLGDGEAQYTLLTNERGGIVDDLIVYRMSHGHYLLVVNAGNREAAYAWLKEREPRGTEVRDASDEYALVAVQGPRSLERLGLDDGAGVHARDGRDRRRRGDGLPHRLHGRDRASSSSAPTRTPCALWDAVLARGVVPCGLGARDTLRLEVCYPLHGNDITQDTDAISAGLGWTCALDKEFTGADVLRRVKEDGPARRLVAFVMEEKAIPRPGMAIEGGGEVTSGTQSPSLDVGIGMGYVPAAQRGAGHGARDRRAWQAPARPGRAEADLPEGALSGRERELPRRPPVPPGARLGAGRRRRGRARHHVVRAGLARRARPLRRRPRSARRSTKDESYGEVESVKAVSDVVAPLSGEVLEVNQKAIDEPETVNDDPYGEGWLVRIRISDPAEVDALLDAAAYRAHIAEL